MRLKHLAKIIAEKLTRTRIFQQLPHGIDVWSDISLLFPQFEPEVMFDVGANVGQSAVQFADCFPRARIFSFEPALGAYERLTRNVADRPNIQCFHFGFGASRGTSTILVPTSSDLASIVASAGSARSSEGESEGIALETVDNFCEVRGVTHISYLKIDTEGYDLEVLKGGVRMLSSNAIDLVEVEAGMNPRNKHHISLEKLKGFLEKWNYYIFGFYEQVYEWPTKGPHLRRANVVFMAERVIEGNK